MRMSRVIESVMVSCTAELLCLVIMLSNLGFGEAILCAKCDSKQHPNCETDPPSPVPCIGSSSITKFCSITRLYRKDGSLMQLSRDCATAQQPEEECKLTNSEGPNVPFKACSITCSTDGCNSAPLSSPVSTFTLLSGLISAIVLTDHWRAGAV